VDIQHSAVNLQYSGRGSGLTLLFSRL
jgi:hypothetical protein